MRSEPYTSFAGNLNYEPLEKPYRTVRPPLGYRRGQKRLKKIGEACKKDKECETFNCVYKKVWPGKGGTTKMCLLWNEHQ